MLVRSKLRFHFICISLITSQIKHIFLCLLAICVDLPVSHLLEERPTGPCAGLLSSCLPGAAPCLNLLGCQAPLPSESNSHSGPTAASYLPIQYLFWRGQSHDHNDPTVIPSGGHHWYPRKEFLKRGTASSLSSLILGDERLDITHLTLRLAFWMW